MVFGDFWLSRPKDSDEIVEFSEKIRKFFGLWSRALPIIALFCCYGMLAILWIKSIFY